MATESLEEQLIKIVKVLDNLHKITLKQRQEIEELKSRIEALEFIQKCQLPPSDLMRYNKL
jgi:archaellum component FlaC